MLLRIKTVHERGVGFVFYCVVESRSREKPRMSRNIFCVFHFAFSRFKTKIENDRFIFFSRITETELFDGTFLSPRKESMV